MSRFVMLPPDVVNDVVVLDDLLAEHVGKENWQGIAWDLRENVPTQTEIAEHDPLDDNAFIAEFTLLSEHFNKPALSTPLLKRYHEIVSEKLSKKMFLEAAKAALTADLYWSKLLGFILNFHSDNQVASQAMYELANKQKNKIDQQGEALLKDLGTEIRKVS